MNNDNNHVRREIVELDQILTDLPMHISLHSCHHVNEWSGSHFLPTPSFTKHSRSLGCSLSIYPFSLDVCFQTEIQHEIIQSGATESVCLPELLPERLKRERLYLLREPTLMYENKHHLMCRVRDRCVPTDTNMFMYSTHSCIA